MKQETIELASAAPGQRAALTVLRFGPAGGAPKAYIQAALHADEIPPLLVAAKLRALLVDLEARGLVAGEVVLVPYANPLGLAQHPLGQHQGRFDLRDGVNFNRQVPDLGAAAVQALQGQLGDDAATNVARVRAELARQAAALSSPEPATDLKQRLLQLALDSDIVLDLHCDGEAVVHVYALTPQSRQALELGACLGAQAVLLATESGDSPFDEACSRPWLQVQQHFVQHALPLGCFSATVELRGQADTDHALATQDAQGIVEFLRHSGVIGGAHAPLPAPRCQATPLAGSESITAPHAGVVVFHVAPGALVQPGTPIADLIDVDSGASRTLHAPCAGVLYARVSTRWATAGARLAKIAGTTPNRSGKLLGP